MEQALMAVCKDIRLGKILIQTNHDTGEPEVCESDGVPLLGYFSVCRCSEGVYKKKPLMGAC